MTDTQMPEARFLHDNCFLLYWSEAKRNFFLLPPAYVVRREVLFSQVCVRVDEANLHFMFKSIHPVELMPQQSHSQFKVVHCGMY